MDKILLRTTLIILACRSVNNAIFQKIKLNSQKRPTFFQFIKHRLFRKFSLKSKKRSSLFFAKNKFLLLKQQTLNGIFSLFPKYIFMREHWMFNIPKEKFLTQFFLAPDINSIIQMCPTALHHYFSDENTLNLYSDIIKSGVARWRILNGCRY